MTQSNYRPGVNINAVNGVQLHPQAQGIVAGGMTYRPQGGVDQRQRHLSHKQESEGSSPSPAPRCPVPTKAGAACKGNPSDVTGFCVGHANMVGAALKELLGG